MKKGQVYKTLLLFLIRILGLNKASKLFVSFLEELHPVIKVQTKRGEILFSCPAYLPLWRAQTLLTKEPETIEWIDNFEDNSVLWDIGANIGTFSLYAALNESTQIFAFEPASTNYNILNENIRINFFDNRIYALNIAFSDQGGINHLFMSDSKVGSAHHSFGEARDELGQSFREKFRQAVFGFKIDDFVMESGIKFPNYLKIDVDGIEHLILAGAEQTLRDKRLKSVLVELDAGRKELYTNTVDFIKSCGFGLEKRVLYSRSRGIDCEMYNNIFHRTN
jgi:FkbM family methyltransferase